MSVVKLVITKPKRRGPLSFDARLFIDGKEQKTALEIDDLDNVPGELKVRYIGGLTKKFWITEVCIVDKRLKQKRK